MADSPLTFRADFDKLVSLSEQQHRDELVACNDAFTAAMNHAIAFKGKYRERVKPGIVVDDRPFVGRIFHPEPRASIYGSPSAMCVESGGPTGDRILR